MSPYEYGSRDYLDGVYRRSNDSSKVIIKNVLSFSNKYGSVVDGPNIAGFYLIQVEGFKDPYWFKESDFIWVNR